MKKNIIDYIYRLWDNRVKPIKAFRAILALDKNKEDTTQVFHVIDALKGGSDRKYFKIFSESEVGKKILKDQARFVLDHSDLTGLLFLQGYSKSEIK